MKMLMKTKPLPKPLPRRRPAAEEARPGHFEALEPRQLLSGGPQILTLGDSITIGTPPDQSYRRELDRAIERAGVDAEFVGSRSDGRGFDSDHYSQSGIRASVSYTGRRGDYRGSLNEGFRSGRVLRNGERPDLILLHIGTNSINGGRGSVDTAANELETLLNTMAERYRRGEFASDVRVLVADIIPGGRRNGSGPNFQLDTNRLENTRLYNERIGQVINRVRDRGFASRVQRVDLARIDASTLDRSAFSAAEWRAIDNDGDRYVDWFNGVNEGGSYRNATSNNAAILSNDLLHPTALGHRVLGQAWFEAVEDTGKLRAPARPAPAPAPPRPAAPTAPPANGAFRISGATTAAVGEGYRLVLDSGGRQGGFYVHFDDGPGRWIPTDGRGPVTVDHTFTSVSDERVIRVHHEVDGRRTPLDRVRVRVTPSATPTPGPTQPDRPAAPTPAAPTPSAGQVAIAGATEARVGEAYTLRLDTGSLRGGRWYVHWDDGPGQWLRGSGAATLTHTFTSANPERVIRVFYEVNGQRTQANRVRVRVSPAGSQRPAPAPPADARGDGRVTRTYWTNVGGRNLSDLTSTADYRNNRPAGTTTLSELRSGDWDNPRDNVSWADDYGERISGFLIAPKTGTYRFYVSGDDQAAFRLSTGQSTSDLRTVARVDGWTRPLEWDKSPEQRSVSIRLVAGQSYAFEVLHKEARGGDHVAVGWRTPGQGDGPRPTEVIGSRHLSTYAV